MDKFCAAFFSLVFVTWAFCGEEAKRSPDSEYHDGVPKGKIEKQPPWHSKIFPGTERDWWIYVPAQYDPAKPANVMVFQDGGGPVNGTGEMRAPVVFDNLINKKEMPVTIGIFINPGVLPPSEPADIKDADGKVIGKKLPRMNRAFEYDSVGDRYARFLLEEIFPEVEKKYNLTKDPAGRAVCGQSSGGSCAFTVAWERPDAFAKVVSGIGSFTSLHGCNAYPDLIRKTEPKPIRIYMQDGDHDLDIYAGSWWHANQDMAAAFNWMGYDYFFLQGHDGHSGKQLGMNFPDAMRWLWRADPVEGKRPEKADSRGIWEVLIKGEGWKLTSPNRAGYTATGTWPNFMAADDNGDVYFYDFQGGVGKADSSGQRSKYITPPKGAMSSSMQFGSDRKLYTTTQDGKLIGIDAQGAVTETADKLPGNTHLVAINHKGEFYLYSVSDRTMRFIDATKSMRVVLSGIRHAGAFLLTPDQGFAVSIYRNEGENTLISYRVEANGDLSNMEAFYTLQSTEGQIEKGNSYALFDEKGRLYVATDIGVQIFDQAGRVIGILSLPERNNIQGMCFGGPKFDTLFAYTNNGIYSRKLNARGVRSCKPPVIPPKPQM